MKIIYVYIDIDILYIYISLKKLREELYFRDLLITL